ncbi:hypothetical protein EPN15_05060 [Patescibacteria group bacterium]|nr:MAG: hypothetical protein EPN15_05060 [Patescibacteria group bacterium]
MKLRKFTFIIIFSAILTGLFLIGTHSYADDDESEKKALERRWEEAKKNAEKQGEAAKKALEKQIEDEKEEYEESKKNEKTEQKRIESPSISPQPEQATQTVQTEQIIIERTPKDLDGDFVPDEFDLYPGGDDFSYLIDSDKDGAVDALDKYPGENDAVYSVIDADENGIVDEVENLANSLKQ